MKSAGKVEFSRKMLKQKTMKNSNCQVHVVVDLSFDHLMIEKVITISNKKSNLIRAI